MIHEKRFRGSTDFNLLRKQCATLKLPICSEVKLGKVKKIKNRSLTKELICYIELMFIDPINSGVKYFLARASLALLGLIVDFVFVLPKVEKKVENGVIVMVSQKWK